MMQLSFHIIDCIREAKLGLKRRLIACDFVMILFSVSITQCINLGANSRQTIHNIRDTRQKMSDEGVGNGH